MSEFHYDEGEIRNEIYGGFAENAIAKILFNIWKELEAIRYAKEIEANI